MNEHRCKLPRSIVVLAAAAVAITAGLGETPARSAEKADGPNVILILADDLGYGELGCYGQKKIRTPHLDRLAADGMRFTRAYAGSPVCAPSRCCLMTGKHGGHAWIRSNSEVQPEGQSPLPAGEVTLAELLKQRGYATAAIGKWGLGPPGSEGDPLRQGFDQFFGYNCQRHAHSHYPTWLRRNGEKIELPGNDGKTGKQFSHDLFEEEALKFLRAHADRPFFLYLPFTIPHVAIQVPEDSLAEYRGKWDDPPYDGQRGYLPQPAPRAGYAAMVTRMDRSVGRILDLLKQLHLDDRTLVLFSSDNGPAPGGVGGSDSEFFASSAGLRGLKGSVYEGGLRVPLIARWTGRIRPGQVSDHVCYFPDLLPTVLDLVGASAGVPGDIDGLSFAPTLLGRPGEQKKHDYLFWEFFGYGGQQAVRRGDWKGVRHNLRKGETRIELYNLKEDPGEQQDVAAQHPDIVKQLEQIMRTARVPSKLFPLPVLDSR